MHNNCIALSDRSMTPLPHVAVKIHCKGPKIEDFFLLLFVVFDQDKAAFSSSEVQETILERTC